MAEWQLTREDEIASIKYWISMAQAVIASNQHFDDVLICLEHVEMHVRILGDLAD